MTSIVGTKIELEGARRALQPNRKPGLLTPFVLGGLELPNRVLMAPLTRSRSDTTTVQASIRRNRRAVGAR